MISLRSFFVVTLLSLIISTPSFAERVCIKAKIKKAKISFTKLVTEGQNICPKGYTEIIDLSAFAGTLVTTGLKGDPGIQGPKGDQGLQGIPGQTGQTGPASISDQRCRTISNSQQTPIAALQDNFRRVVDLNCNPATEFLAIYEFAGDFGAKVSIEGTNLFYSGNSTIPYGVEILSHSDTTTQYGLYVGGTCCLR